MCHRNQIIASALTLSLACTSSTALAQEAPATSGEAEMQLYTSTDADNTAAVSSSSAPVDYTVPPSAATVDAQPRGPDAAYPPWGTAPNSWELGIFWGAFIPSGKHELYNAGRASINYQKLEYVTPELGLRVAWFPHPVLGLELEGAFLPSQTRTTDQAVNLWAARGHLILQAPTKTIVPFLLAGGGLLGIASSNKVLGNDFDSAAHFGAGLKGYITKNLALRLEGRGTVSQGYGKDQLALHWEALLGASVVLGRPEPPPPPPDSDGDGVLDPQDQCPQLAGVPPLGCPPPPPDADGDGVPDAEDRCPEVAGVASSDPEKNGCPLPPPDSDGDGVPDADDKCPNVVGDGPDGCVQDSDGDRIPNRDDKCPDQPETRNGFEDEDGCPDELPQAVKKFTGAIKGIVFESGKATIRKESFPTLDAAVKVLAEYQALRLEISGHTDSTGTAERNLVLSKERAEAVKLYFTGRGIAAERIETRGAGPNEPVADNSTKEGRTMNRRIEFKLIQKPDGTDAAVPSPAPDAPPAPAALPTPAPQTNTPTVPHTAGPTPAPPSTAPQATPPAAAPREAPVPQPGSGLQPAPAPTR